MFPNYFAAPPATYQPAPSNGSLRPSTCQLAIRQQPKEALVTIKDKEKVRKPVDPPPMLELTVNGSTDQQFLQNPYLFVCATLYKSEKDEPFDASANASLAGTLVSSLHRLKDTNNKDGGFFVFGDISVKVQGTFRLYFTLYEFLPNGNEVQHLAGVISEKFKVVLPKDFKGLEESTYLSRAFSDQGVRLRLRKEPRGMMSNKRSYSGEPAPIANTPIRPNVEYPAAKKARQEYPVNLNSTTSASSMAYQMNATTMPYAMGHPSLGMNMTTPLSMYRNSPFQYTNGDIASSVPQHTGYPSSHIYPPYGHRNVAASSVDDAAYPPHFSTSDSPYLG